ncbi:MAG: hypothetical protein LBU38_02110, partial [Propionibacteriaceae bacterium]|nr:hypothetical protein [Propionibacteriaceae bacterium]
MSISRLIRRLLISFSAASLAFALSYAALPARAQSPTDEIHTDVEIVAISLSGETPKDTLTITADVKNATDLPTYGVQAVLWRSSDPISDIRTL